MKKEKIGPKTFLYPMPTVIVGALIDGKPNYETIAFCSAVQVRPAMIAISSHKEHLTNKGIEENKTFSINIPSEEMIKVTDYIGIHSGRKIDKSKLFKSFTGKLETAPMIEECPVNLECRLVKTVDIGGPDMLFIGEVVEAYCQEQYMTNGLPDMSKIKPILFSMHDNKYYGVGNDIGKAWSIGKEFTK
jgi:flavin reductase (DIM6/NTAB) family NADH-FMN oxidoreductase RutF